MHGKQSRVRLDPDCPLFQNCPETAPVARYHSLIAKADTLPDCLRVTAVTEKGEVMAVRIPSTRFTACSSIPSPL